jgi:nicotinate-nucleotide pyrophosphorylase (carboxylating)
MSIDDFIRAELEIDRINDDVTSQLLGDKAIGFVTAIVRAKAPGVFAGEKVCQALSRVYGNQLKIRHLKRDGDTVGVGDTIVALSGTLSLCLGVERTLLNFLCHLSGIATLTHHYVRKAGAVKILATRKTLPGLRDLQLQAVVAGGGFVHRRSLSDGILIKENHQAFELAENLLERAKSLKSPLHGVEVEVQNISDLDRILPLQPTVVMLDNFPLKDLQEAIPKIRRESKCAIEVSGGVNLDTIQEIAELKPDYISVGALTHSAPVLDLSLDLALDLENQT